MGKNKNKHRPNQRPGGSTKPTLPESTPAQPAPSIAGLIRDLAEDANRQMTEADIATPPTIPPPPSITEIDVPCLWKLAHEAKELFDRAKVRAIEADERARACDSELREKMAKVEKRESELATQRDEQRRLQRELEESKQELVRREKRIAEEEGRLKEREIAAEAGFQQQHRHALAKLDEEAKALSKQITDHHQGYLSQLKEYEVSVRQIRDRELAGIEEQRRQLEIQLIEVAKLKREAEWAKMDADGLKSSLRDRADKEIRDAVADREIRLQSALATCADLAERLGRYEQAERLAAGKTREELLAEVRTIQERNARLVAELAKKPAEEQVARLGGLESERETLLSDIATLRQRNQVLEVQMGKLSIGVAETQNLRDQKAAWDSREAALRACIDGLRRELGELVDKTKSQQVFPSLSSMDTDGDLQTPPHATRAKLSSLKEFVDEVRSRIAAEGLFYREKDIRAFLAGLASSRLHLLQGISGTGKTSLPVAFAKAVGAFSSLIEVQSGWRDRNDLLGYYNAFERRFYESEFLQALYRAQQPRHLSLPYFIVLDEMNLSHPEHYFADFLSALEQAESKQHISLLTARIDGAPKLLEDARWLRIPSNVWFIGTANHDETTKDFAPKTYDRAHVMEFPRHPESFEFQPHNAPHSLSMEVLEGGFRRARQAHQAAATRTIDFLEKCLTNELSRLGLGWGNRLDRQIRSFVPVIVEAGGTLGEATDHVVATKLLRKLGGRFDLNASQLKEFQEKLNRAWENFDASNPPEKCVELLNHEIKRLSGGTA
jgi:hypothetical protein